MKLIKRMWCWIVGHKPAWEGGTVWLDNKCKVHMLTQCMKCELTLIINMSSEENCKND